MARSKAIDKKSLTYKSMDYNALRKEGIALIEKYSGHIWTDYNVHDPGVTILEALCYVLTELGYKAGFPLEDILYSSPDKTGFLPQENAFYTPQQIFPCHPVTTLDFRELLVDRIEVVNDAWVFVDHEKQARDLREAWLLLDDDINTTEAVVIEEARQLLAAHRNLCEDVSKISILPRESCKLEATIFIDNKIDPEKTAAKILFELENTLLNPTLTRYSVSEMLDNNIPMETIFDGPEMYHGYFNRDTLSDFPMQLDLLNVMNTILDIDGVFHISDLAVIYKGKRYTDHIELDYCLPVFRPDFSGPNGHEMYFYKNETQLPFNALESVQIYEQLKSQQKRNYTIDTATDTTITHQEGRFRAISNYLSVQHEFPNTYGIGKYGLLPQSSKERKAQAKQLKGFLLHFDQLLANSFAQLANVKYLFSIYPVTQTYFHQPLTDVPGLVPLITDSDKQEETALPESKAEIIAAEEAAEMKHYGKWKGKLEDESTFLKRRNDFLNHLLARFNVSFNESIYYDFGYSSQKSTILKRLINAKEYYLQHIVSLLRNRSRGNNYLLDKQQKPLSFKKQLELLLDINPNKNERISSPMDDVVFDLMFMIDSEAESDEDDNTTYVFSRENILEDFLKTGIEKENYTVDSSLVNSSYRILLDLENDAITIEIGTARDMDEAITEIERLCEKVLQLSIQTEGFYVMEHLLLRPSEDSIPEEEAAFYDHRMSLIFPAWPARFQRRGFREQVRAIIADIVPAHIRADAVWVSLESMKDFESIHESWKQARIKDPDAEETLEYAAALKEILESYNTNTNRK